MKKIKIKCPAKINLDLMVYKKEHKAPYHKIKSIMQTINLFDFITIELDNGEGISLFGNSSEIPYDDTNLCYKSAELFFDKIKTKYKTKIYIEKNIPVCAGLAGGSTDAAGVLWGLNKLLDYPLSLKELNETGLMLGSDVNFCLIGGTKLCKGRGEIIIDMPFYDFKLSLVKPKHLKISAKEAYSAFDELKKESEFRNDLEFALIDKYEELQYLHSLGLQMSGSGPAYFMRDKNIDFEIDRDKYLVINNLKSVNHGVVDI